MTAKISKLGPWRDAAAIVTLMILVGTAALETVKGYSDKGIEFHSLQPAHPGASQALAGCNDKIGELGKKLDVVCTEQVRQGVMLANVQEDIKELRR